MFSNSGDDALSFFVKKESSSLFAPVYSFCPSFLWGKLTFSCRFTYELSTSKFGPEVHQFPEAKRTLFLLSSFPILTRYLALCGAASFALTVYHRFRGFVLSLFRHATNHKALSGLREKTFDMATRIHRESHYIKQTQNVDSTHLSINFLWSERQQVGFWCQHI